MKLKILTVVTTIAALLVAAAVGGASATEAAPKRGFVPGTWIGSGTIKGFVQDGPMTTRFSGRIAFTLKVNKKLAASGRGTRRMKMVGSQDAAPNYRVDSTLRGYASISLAGTSTSVTYSGTQDVVGEIKTAGFTRPVSMPDQDVEGRLVITKARTCAVAGTSVIQDGVTLTWSAKRKGTCNA